MTIYVQITGRLGNNLFQIAVGYSLAKQRGTDFVMVYNEHNRYEQEWIKYFSGKAGECTFSFIPRTGVPRNVSFFTEKNNRLSCFDKHVLPDGKELFMDGYFQNEQYFKEYRSDLKKLFLRNEVKPIDGYFIHVRRSDYVNHPVYQIDYPSYFKKAIRYFPQGCKWYIVSDDIPYCKSCELFENLDKEYMDLGTIDTLHFMAGCRGGICANSSFSWWGAWLSSREIVTMPRTWINNGMNSQGVHFEGAIVIS